MHANVSDYIMDTCSLTMDFR